jgi:hypothetical protein
MVLETNFDLMVSDVFLICEDFDNTTFGTSLPIWKSYEKTSNYFINLKIY